MTYQLFDLTGREQYCCAIASGEKDVTIIEQQPLRTLLIQPKDGSNKSPYLQDPENPCIEDFITAEGDFKYENSDFLSEILKDEKDTNSKETKEGKKEQEKHKKEIIKRNMRLLEYYFQAQIKLLNKFSDSDQSIILVPDHYDAEKQERILRACQMPRSRTLLLWRSVAICLGAEDYFPPGLLHDDSKIAIVDGQAAGSVNISILTLKKTTCNGLDWLVPARHAYRRQEFFSLKQGTSSNPFEQGSNTSGYDFWQHTWQKNGKFLVPDQFGWYEGDFLFPTFECDFTFPGRAREVDLIIISGSVTINNFPFNIPCIIENDSENFALLGAGRFVVRRGNKLPTYFDECESLFFIAQAPNMVFAQKLINGGEYCPGGSEIRGEPDKNFQIEKGNDFLRFLLHVGEINDDTPLKELVQGIPKQSTEDQKLVLSPSMIPGQGIAKVQVDARPLLSSDIELDFLKMQDATYEDEAHRLQPETIQHLRDSIKLGYPIDFPGVKARSDFWNTFRVRRLFGDEWVNYTGIFYHPIWPNMQRNGIERFERNNVFGNVEGYMFPSIDIDFIYSVFGRIKHLYESNQNNVFAQRDAILLAAWTYRCGTDFFQCIIDDTLEKIKRVSNGATVPLVAQEFTVCANMLSDEEKKEYMDCFNRLCWSSTSTVKHDRDWIRALQGILIDSYSFLEDDSDRYEKCMEHLFHALENAERRQRTPLIRSTLCCMLLLLRRRKYEPDFLRQGSSLFVDIENIIHNLNSSPGNKELADTLLNFMMSNGSIPGLAKTAKAFKENG